MEWDPCLRQAEKKGKAMTVSTVPFDNESCIQLVCHVHPLQPGESMHTEKENGLKFFCCCAARQ